MLSTTGDFSYKTVLDIPAFQVCSFKKRIFEFRPLTGKHPVGRMGKLVRNQWRNGIADMAVLVRKRIAAKPELERETLKPRHFPNGE